MKVLKFRGIRIARSGIFILYVGGICHITYRGVITPSIIIEG
jgi:hypothetical protein